MFSKLLCKILGHKRGKRITNGQPSTERVYECPRCKARWTRKVKVPA